MGTKKLFICWAVWSVLFLPSVAVCRTSVARSDFELLLDAIAQVESGNRSNAIGDKGRAIGAYQIHRAYWTDGTRLLGVKWSYSQAFNAEKARSVVRAYLRHYGRGRGLIEMARIHNGGPRGYRKKATAVYGRKVLRLLQSKSQNSPRHLPDILQITTGDS